MVRNKLKEIIYSVNLKFLNFIGFTNKLKASDAQFKIDVTSKNVVIISPHPDDEIIGCSSVIYDSISNGNQVHVFLLTGNECRVNETRGALDQLHSDIKLHCLDYSDGVLSGKETEITSSLVCEISRLNLDECTLFIPCQKDFHSDHIAAFFSGMDVYRNLDIVSECFSYRTNHVSLLSDFFYYNTIEAKKKREAYSFFISQSYLCFENLFKVRRLYHNVGYELESELFSINKLEESESLLDYREFSQFQRYENNLSDIHPYKLALNHKIAHREFFKHAEK